FGGFLLLSGLLDVCFSQLHGLLIGKLYSARDLGLYVRAFNSRQMPLGLLESIFNRVTFPAFSRTADDKDYLLAGLKRTLATMMFFNIPAMIGLAVIAEPLIEVLFGSNWLPAAPILQVLCLAGVFWPMHTANLNTLMALGRSDLYFRIEIIKKLIGIASVVIACPLGVLAIAGAQLVTSVICIFINAYYTGIFLGYGPVRQLLALLPNLGAGALLGASLWVVRVSTHMSPLAELPVLISLGVAIYIGVSGGIFKLKAFEEMWAQVRSVGGGRKP
ncbi:MAG: oligosaccharide flippase family protein, partial [Proteobacteria bacterium]|nr:oligosaccharide flippase family protein [Pseudomonadota bacterium]